MVAAQPFRSCLPRFLCCEIGGAAPSVRAPHAPARRSRRRRLSVDQSLALLKKYPGHLSQQIGFAFDPIQGSVEAASACAEAAFWLASLVIGAMLPYGSAGIRFLRPNSSTTFHRASFWSGLEI